jgi:hypothetical protein
VTLPKVPRTQKLHVLCVSTESGDTYGPFLFERKPADTQLNVFLEQQLPLEEFEPGPGWRNTHIHLEWSRQPVHTGAGR